MRTSVLTLERSLHRRFANLSADALLHARDEHEQLTVEKVVSAVRAGHINVRDGRAALASLRRQQTRAA